MNRFSLPHSSPDRSLHPERRAALEALRQLAREMAGKKLPGERELSQRLHISRQQLRGLLDVLETEGVVERRQGSGTYATDARHFELHHVGLVIDAHLKLGNDPFFSLLTERLQLGLQAAGIHCVVERTGGASRPRFLGNGVIALGLAGLGALSHLRVEDPPALSLLAEEQYPHHFAGAVSVLLMEDHGAGLEAGKRAIEEGCRRLFFFGRGHIPASRGRWEGIQQAALRAEEPITAEIHECAMNFNAGRTAGQAMAEQLRGVPVREVGLIASNDWLAVGLRAGLTESGSPLRERPIYSFDGLSIAQDPAQNIRSLCFPVSIFVEDTLAELRRLTGQRIGRVIRYNHSGWSDRLPPDP
ncbi:MAG: GntR family transcriptional regulator [Capsulimonadales bacterium]|nr:GntR family transcriptional regulator [Capsulimonadales bacterium]